MRRSTHDPCLDLRLKPEEFLLDEELRLCDFDLRNLVDKRLCSCYFFLQRLDAIRVRVKHCFDLTTNNFARRRIRVLGMQLLEIEEIGRASCRERVCQYV